jgi:hypothetical protein
MVCGRRAAHLVPADMGGDVLVKRRKLAVTSVLVEDVLVGYQDDAIDESAVPRSPQLGVFRLGLLEDRDVEVGVFPEGEGFKLA